MKRTIAVFLSSIFLLLLFDSNVWASCGPKEYDTMSGIWVCNNLAGQNEPCGPNPGDWCCTTAGECSSVPTPTPGGPGPTIPPYNPECDGGAGVKSALGCLPVSAILFQYVASPWAIFLGAGVAFLLGLYGALLIVTSSGDPEKVQAGKELITSVILGLLIIIFGVFLMEIIGVDILGLFRKI